MEDYFAYMAQALNEANKAALHGDVPVGAVAVANGQVIAARHNEKELRQNPTCHAEILLVDELARARSSWHLDGVTVVLTLEPCLMCIGALLAARVERVVFGAHDPKAGACGTLYNPGCDPRLNHQIEIVGGVREVECSALLADYFGHIRNSRGDKD